MKGIDDRNDSSDRLGSRTLRRVIRDDNSSYYSDDDSDIGIGKRSMHG